MTNINDLTIGQAKELVAMFPQIDSVDQTKPHDLDGDRVLAVLPNGFIHFGRLNDLKNGRYVLTEASNLRYWKQRDDGLPSFAKDGPIDGDRIDWIGTVYIETVLFFYPLGNWS